MEQILIPFITSLLLSLALTPPSIKFAKKYKLITDPQTKPHPAHIQDRIIPRAGGLPIFLSLFISIMLFVPPDKHIAGIVLSLIILLITGLIDDKLKNFSPFPRLGLQILSAAVVVASGVGISFVTNPTGGILRLDQIVYPLTFFGAHNIVLIADLFAFLWIVWMMNMINWAKGVDGQMPGIVTIASLTIGYLSYNLYLQGDPHQLPIAILAFITAGASLGWLPFNWYPSKMLPGFSGSTVLAFMIAVLSILSGAKLATAILVLLIPSIDFFYTFFRRLLSGHSPFYGDQKHLHHLLLKRGWSHSQISLFYIISCAILGLSSTLLSSKEKLFTSLIVGVMVLGSIIWLHLFYKDTEQTKK